MLVIAGSNVQRVDVRGYTAAHLAASQGHVEVLDKLLMAGDFRRSRRNVQGVSSPARPNVWRHWLPICKTCAVLKQVSASSCHLPVASFDWRAQMEWTPQGHGHLAVQS